MEHITINSDRSVTVPVELRKIGVQYDHNVNTIEFVGPRYSGNVDLSTMTIYINYILSDKTPGKYKAENVIIDDQDNSLIRFNWTITRNVTKVSGILSCLICAKKTDEEGNEINHWNTDIFRLLSVSEGMENDLVIQEQYPDVITSIMQNIEEHNAKLLEFSGLNIRVTDLENNVDKLKDKIDKNVADVGELKDDLSYKVYIDGIDEITADNTEFIKKVMSENVCNNEKITSGYTMNVDGKPLENASRAITDYIYCYGKSVFSTNYGLTGAYCFYGRNKNFLGFVSYANVRENLSIPTYEETVYYMRLSLLVDVVGSFGVYFSEVAPSYTTYRKKLVLSDDIIVRNYTARKIIANLIKNGGTLKFIGDSITQGVGGTGFNADGEEICTIGSNTWKVNTSGYYWVNLVKNYVMNKFPNVTIKNYGTRSFTSENLVSQIKLGNIVDGTEDVIVCMIGTNDKWNGNLDTLKENLRFLIDLCEINKTALILVSAPISTVACDTLYNGTEVKFHNEDIDHVYMQVCEENNIPYISMYQNMLRDIEMLNVSDLDTIFSDGLHPNDEGYYLMYKIIMREFGLAYQMPNSSWDDASPNT